MRCHASVAHNRTSADPKSRSAIAPAGPWCAIVAVRRHVQSPCRHIMNITRSLFDAYLKCRTKCWHLSRSEPVADLNRYATWMLDKNATYAQQALRKIPGIRHIGRALAHCTTFGDRRTR